MTEITLKIFQISIHSEENLTTARIFGRSKEGQKVCLEDTTFDYFFVNVNNIDPEPIITHIKQQNKEQAKVRVEKVDAEIHDTPKKLLKIYTPSTIITESLVKELKEIHNAECFEHDVEFERKYLLEKQIFLETTYTAEYLEKKIECNADITGELIKLQESSEKINPKILYFDIETYDNGKGISYDANPILMISVFGDEEKVFVAQNYTTNHKKVQLCKNEKEMLVEFENYVKKYNPDILSGYNIKGFDIPYLLKRYEIHKIPVSLGASGINTLKNKKKIFAEGVLLFDIYQLLRNIMRNSITDGIFTLDNVSQKLLHEKKIEVELPELSKVWDDPDRAREIDTYVEYCLKDSILCDQLWEYFKYDTLEFARMLNVDYEQLTHLSFSQIVEYYLIQRSREFNQVIPNKPDQEDIKTRSDLRFQGAFVFDPKPGLYENIAVFDFRSLYPSIIESHNITKGRLNRKKIDNSFEVPGKPYFFEKEPKAFIPTLTEQIIERRGRLKELIKTTDEKDKPILKSRILTLKIIANSLYGYLGFYMARWYSFECAESVTAFGRHYIKEVIETFNKKELEVIYSDTDSIFILLKNKDIDYAIKLADETNEKLPGMMTLELENIYDRGIFVELRGVQRGAKKKYALLDKEQNMKVAGMIMVRGDWSGVARKIQREVTETLLKTKNVGLAQTFVKEQIKKLSERPLKDFVITTRLKKPVEEYETKGPHVIAAMRMKEKGEYVRAGSNISYIIVKGDTTRIGDRARLPEEVDKKNIDYEYYIDNQILPALEGIFDVFGIDINEVHNMKDQQSLNSFFK